MLCVDDSPSLLFNTTYNASHQVWVNYYSLRLAYHVVLTYHKYVTTIFDTILKSHRLFFQKHVVCHHFFVFYSTNFTSRTVRFIALTFYLIPHDTKIYFKLFKIFCSVCFQNEMTESHFKRITSWKFSEYCSNEHTFKVVKN